MDIPTAKGAKIRIATHFYIREKQFEQVIAAFKEFFKIK